jgi:hypothetical protein
MTQPLGEGPGPSIRRTLFGDMPLADWCGGRATGEPWTRFARARDLLAKKDTDRAAAELERIVATPGLESRHYIQAWQVLREIGRAPAEAEADRVFGVVVEVSLDTGLDLLAAYADRHARYYNFSGAGVVWERPDGSLDEPITRLLDAGQAVADNTGTWDEPRPGVPPKGQVRFSTLTPGGIHFGQGTFEAFAGDPLAGSVLGAATALMQQLIEKKP